MLEMFAFGLSFLSFVYLLSFLFNKQNSAIKWTMPILVLLGTILPFLLLVAMAASDDNDDKITIFTMFFYYCCPITTNYVVTFSY